MINLRIYCDQFDFSHIEKAFKGEFSSDVSLSAEIILCGEEEIKSLNNRFRNKDAVTDVLSFPALDGIFGVKIKKADFPYDIGEDKRLSIGSIAICEKRAKEQAEEYGHSYERELNYLAVHGLCHLLGYDHENEEDKKVMREKEERILAKSGIER
ncbi:MAG: rRNA maturation RNase YbeY [Clostridia bacterium]|nr:rRNA maturation RNase YbeY [Clostridia bacterium]